MKPEIFESKFDKPVLIDSTYYYHNQVVEIGLSLYSDCSNEGTWYKFSSPNSDRNELMDLGACSTRKRKDVLFTKEDARNFIDRKIEDWKEKDSFKFKNKGKDYLKVTDALTYGMMISARNKMYEIYPCKIEKGDSVRSPYSLKLLDDYHSTQRTSTNRDELLTNVYLFDDEGIANLKEDFLKIISNYLVD